MMRRASLLLIAVCALRSVAAEPDSTGSSSVIGPRNPDLYYGAEALRSGDGENGIRLTRRGLALANTPHERGAAYANLCAGYILTKEYDKALIFCNQALTLDTRDHRALSNRALVYYYQKNYDLALRDVEAGLAISPSSYSLKKVARMIEDAVNPVTPSIAIEHREVRD